jgi:hypothetical protein
MKLIPITFSLILICLLLQTASARDYKIEMILFTHTASAKQTFSNRPPLKVPTNGITLQNVGSDSKWQPVGEDQFILGGVARNLAASNKYRVLKHFAWRQPVVERREALAIDINAGRDFTNAFPERTFRATEFNDQNLIDRQRKPTQISELAGTVTVAIGQYIHLYTDLVYRKPVSLPPELRASLNRDQTLVDHGIQSHRRMRSGELHYIDHPLVGIIIEATPIKE